MSTNTKHTPGPWVACDIKDSLGQTAGLYEVYNRPFGLGRIGWAVTKEDARLIAAAPDLLDICESILGEVEYEGLNLESGRVAKLRAAIAKATGNNI